MSTIETLKEVGALLEGHFLLSSGRHSDKYCQCAKLLMYPDKAAKVLATVVDQIKDVDIDLVVGPAMGGVVVSYEVGRQLGKRTIFTERENGVMTLRRGFTIEKGEKVIITEDVVTTGKSFNEAIEAVKAAGGEVVAIACIVDRRAEGVEFDLPLYSAIKLDVKSYDANECPLCKEGTPFIKPGSRNLK